MALKLNKREKYALYIGAGILCLFVLIQFGIYPFIEKRQRLSRILDAKRRVYEEIVALRSEYDIIKKQADLAKVRYSRRPKDFTLFSFLDKLAGQTGIKDHITYMKPSSSVQKETGFKMSMVEMKLQEITLQQLTLYLHGVETSPNMARVKRISISKEGQENSAINVVLQVETLEI